MHAPPDQVDSLPRFRGVSHLLAFGVSVVAGVVLVVTAKPGAARATAAIYAPAIAGLFGFSALLHRGHWRPSVRRRLRRIDHSMIFVAIAGTYTPIAALTLPRATARIVLVVIWVGAVAGIVFRMAWLDAPRRLVALPYVLLGWVAIATAPGLWRGLGVVGFLLLMLGGLLYTLGALVYARRRPDPRPTVFGFHEVFHALVVAAAAIHYTVVAAFALPRG
ncbi:MAG: PAQR family membrane homeostasis protein TrhA [Acidimicrobiales bacterium]